MSFTKEYLGFLNSNTLWKSEKFGLTQFDFENLAITSKLPKTLDLDIGINEVLGKRVEFFFEYLINTTNNYKILGKSLQVFKNKITIGELDFIIRDLKTKKVIHLEIVYKFYVYDHTLDSELNRWIGPNRKDTLLQKIEKLNNKQLPLLYNSETVKSLHHLDIDVRNTVQKVCFMANLFVPKSLYINNTIIPTINNKTIVGYWIKLKDFKSDSYANNSFYLPKKKDWIVIPDGDTQWDEFDVVIKQIENNIEQKKSPLLWMKRGDNNFERFFVVWW